MKLKQPLLPMSLFKIRHYWVAVIVGSVGQMSFYAMNVLCKCFRCVLEVNMLTAIQGTNCIT